MIHHIAVPKRGAFICVDDKSPVPPAQQIRDQVQRFTDEGRIDTKKFASMDKFKEMILIEQKFGAIPMGRETKVNEEIEKIKRQALEKKETSLWKHVAEKLIAPQSTSKDFRMFKDLIHSAIIEGGS